jgi:hypothetical protein
MKKISLVIYLILIFLIYNGVAHASTTSKFYITENSQNGAVKGFSGAGVNWPPPYNTNSTTLRVSVYNSSSFDEYYQALFSFDTSSLPDNAQISAASLEMYPTTIATSPTVNCEYYTNTLDFTANNYTTSVIGTTAFQSSSWTLNTTSSVSLSNLANINKTGNTAFRMGVNFVTEPASESDLRIHFSSRYDGANRQPILSITYTTPPSAPGNPTFTNVANKAMTISWTAATGATSYTLQRGGSNISTNATSPYNDSGLSVATSYTYRVIAVNADGSTNCAADQSQTTTYWSKKMNGSTVKKINGSYVDKVNGL